MTSKNDNRWVVISIVSVTFGFMCFVLILWKIGLFDFSGTDATARIVASVLALVGGLFGSIITLIGIFLKHSIDQRTVELNNQAERRLKLEAAIQAVRLLSSSSDTDVPVTQRAGVLFTLANLGLPDLGISMLNQMLPSDRIDAGTASWVINHTFHLDDPHLQVEASEVLDKWHEKFLTEKGGVAFPSCVSLDWNMQLPKLARRNIALALLRIILARKYKEWDGDTLNAMIATLCQTWKKDIDDEIHNGVGICLNNLLQIRVGKNLYPPDGPVQVDNFIRAVGNADQDKTSTAFWNLRDRLEKWVADSKMMAHEGVKDNDPN